MKEPMMTAQTVPALARRLGRRPREALSWARYMALHEAIRLPLIGLHRLTFSVSGQRAARNEALEKAVRRRYRELLRQDFQNARSGLYPMELLFDVPLRSYARRLPRFLLDTPNVLQRLRSGDFQDLPGDVDLETFPPYYRQTFHWQTDGYFSRQSAELYDLGVELLFVGCADVMRRQALAEVTKRKPAGDVRLLDVGTGTGRFLEQLARTLPGSDIVGVDLSPWYAAYARDSSEQLDDEKAAARRELRVQVANAEALPFGAGAFEVVTSVFMLHELPRRVRRSVLREMRRVLVPGGLLVLMDAAQPSDSPELAPALDQFSRDLHEPYFADYLKDDLRALLEESGFGVEHVAPHFVAKVVSARPR
jgi:ubiquinone/menaquinone biosynthesis C-methylase UbiE